LPLFENFPPLTSRVILQYKFFKKCLLNPDIDFYFKERGNKYLLRDTILSLKFIEPTYFKE
jgi:hypothetical protein